VVLGDGWGRGGAPSKCWSSWDLLQITAPDALPFQFHTTQFHSSGANVSPSASLRPHTSAFSSFSFTFAPPPPSLSLSLFPGSLSLRTSPHLNPSQPFLKVLFLIYFKWFATGRRDGDGDGDGERRGSGQWMSGWRRDNGAKRRGKDWREREKESGKCVCVCVCVGGGGAWWLYRSIKALVIYFFYFSLLSPYRSKHKDKKQ